jgi:hypothetical protein
MRYIRNSSPQKGDGSAGQGTTFDCSIDRRSVRRTLLWSLICLPYAVFGAVIWTAYDQLGDSLPLDRAPLVAADRTPLKLVPGLDLPERPVPEGDAGSAAHRLAAIKPGRPAARVDEAEPPALIALPSGMNAIDDAAALPRPEDDPSAGEATVSGSEDGPIAGAAALPRSREDAIAASRQIRLAAAPEAAPAAPAPTAPAPTALAPTARVPEPAAGSRPAPRPSSKPIEIIQAASMEAARQGRIVAAQLAVASAPPARPALKPILAPAGVLPTSGPEPKQAPGTRAVAAADATLPDALRS